MASTGLPVRRMSVTTTSSASKSITISGRKTRSSAAIFSPTLCRTRQEAFPNMAIPPGIGDKTQPWAGRTHLVRGSSMKLAFRFRVTTTFGTAYAARGRRASWRALDPEALHEARRPRAAYAVPNVVVTRKRKASFIEEPRTKCVRPAQGCVLSPIPGGIAIFGNASWRVLQRVGEKIAAEDLVFRPEIVIDFDAELVVVTLILRTGSPVDAIDRRARQGRRRPGIQIDDVFRNGVDPAGGNHAVRKGPAGCSSGRIRTGEGIDNSRAPAGHVGEISSQHVWRRDRARHVARKS